MKKQNSKSIFRNTWAILNQKERKRFTLQIFLDVIISIADIVFLAGLLWIINFYIQPKTNIFFLPNWLDGQKPTLLISAFVILFAIKNIAAYFVTRSHNKFTENAAVRISKNMMNHYLQSDYTEFVTTDSSAWIRKIALQPFDFAQQVLSGFQQVFAQSILIIISVIAILLFNAKLFFLLLIILLPPVIAVFFFIRKRIGKIKKNIRDNNERSYQYLLDVLKGYAEANIYQRKEFFTERFISYRQKFSKDLFSSLSLQSLPGRMIEIFAITGLFILVAIAEWTGNTNSNTLITIGAFMAAAYKIIPGIVKIINLSGQIKAYEFSAEELAPIIKKGMQDSKARSIHSIELKSISFTYNDRELLKNFSLDAKKGDIISIYGESGIGKTTIINLLLGFLRPTGGEIYINDHPVNNEALQQYWPSISYVRQQSFFIYDTIEKNIILQQQAADEIKLSAALKISGLDKLMLSFPEGLQKMITENGKNISGGQQQRIALARAIYKDADLILLDEPLNELDETSSIDILEQLKQLSAQGKIIIMITHDKKSLAFCTKIISID